MEKSFFLSLSWNWDTSFAALQHQNSRISGLWTLELRPVTSQGAGPPASNQWSYHWLPCFGGLGFSTTLGLASTDLWTVDRWKCEFSANSSNLSFLMSLSPFSLDLSLWITLTQESYYMNLSVCLVNNLITSVSQSGCEMWPLFFRFHCFTCSCPILCIKSLTTIVLF